MARMTFKLVVITSSVVNIPFIVAEITFKVAVITSAVVKITFVVVEITFKVAIRLVFYSFFLITLQIYERILPTFRVF